MAETDTKKKSGGVLVQAGILAVASMLVRIIGLLYRGPLTAIIGDEGNGYYGTAYNIYTIILMVSSYSVPSAISKLMAQKLAVGEYKNAQKIFRCALVYGMIVGVAASALLFFGADVLVPHVAAGVLRVFAPTVFLFGLLGALRGYFQASGSMVQTSVSQILEQLANAVVSIGAAWVLMHYFASPDPTSQAQHGAMGSALGTGAGVAIALIFVFVCYLRHRKADLAKVASDTTGKEDSFGAAMKETILVITPFMLSGFILNLTTSLNQTIYYKLIISVRGLGDVEATTLYGIFSNKAVVISNIPISIATAVASAIIPGISAAYAKRDLAATRVRAGNAIRATAVIAIPSACGLAFLARPITMILFPQMESLGMAAELLALLAVTVIFYSIATITNAVLQSIGKMNMPLVSAGIALAIQTAVLAVLLLGTDLGIYALALVSVIYSLLIFAVNNAFLKKYLGYVPDVKNVFLKPLAFSLVMGAAALAIYEVFARAFAFVGRAYFVNLFASIIALVCAVVIYFFLMLRSGTLTEHAVLSVPKGAKIAKVLRKLHWIR